MAEIGAKLVWTWCPVCGVRTDHWFSQQERVCTGCQTTTKQYSQTAGASLAPGKGGQSTPRAPGAIPAG